jgi:hypothetical protein
LFSAHTGAGAVALPTTGGRTAYVDHLWNDAYTDGTVADLSPKAGPKNFVVEVRGTSAFSVTSAKLYGLALSPLVIADDAIDSIAGDVITAASHGLKTGDGPVVFTGTTDAFTIGDEYYIIYLTDNTYSLAVSRKNALAGTALTLTGTTEAATLTDTSDTCRVHQHLMDNLGVAADGAITITAQEGWSQIYDHSPRFIGYQMSASYTGVLSVDVYPLEEYLK